MTIEEKDFNLIVVIGDEQRIGQKMVNFINWMNTIKGIQDIFYIKDREMIKYWEEFNRSF